MFLAFVTVTSMMVGTVAFTGTAVAGATGAANGTVSPDTVTVGTTNSYDVGAVITDVSTDDDTDGGTVTFTFTGGLDLTSSSSVSNIAIGPNVTVNSGATTVDAANNNVTIGFDDDSGVTVDREDVTVSFTISDVEASSAGTHDIDVSSNTNNNLGQDGFVTPIASVTVNAGGSDNRAANADGTGAYNTADGTGYIFPGATVFQGEGDITFAGSLGSTLTGVSGDAEGQVLDAPVARDQTQGRYTTDGESGSPGVTVNRPRITDFEIQNVNGEDIAGGSVGEDNADELTVVAESNYEVAEDLELTVENSNGLEVTDDVVTSGANPQNERDSAPTGQASWEIDLSDQSSGTFTIEVAGSDDLDFGAAVTSDTLEVTGDDRVQIDFESDTVSQGEDVVYTVRGSDAADFHLVTIEDSEFRDGITAEDTTQVFRATGDVAERGAVNASGLTSEPRSNDGGTGTGTPFHTPALAGSLDRDDVSHAYAIVEIDDSDGLGQGSIETKFLDDSSVDVEVSSELATSGGDLTSGDGSTVRSGAPEAVSAANFEQDQNDFDVEEGDVSIESPGSTYVVNSEVEVNGTAPAGMDDVAIYVRDEGDFELVTIDGQPTIDVENDGTFEEEDVVFSDGSSILQLPGTYRVGVIDASDADADGDGSVDSTLTTSEFNAGTSTQRSLRVTGTSLNASFPSLVNEQIATEDGNIDVEGSAPGSREVLFIAVDRRGDIVTQTINVDDDDTFEEEDVNLQIGSSGGMSEGAVSVHVYSPGRDGDVGDGDLPSPATGASDVGDLQTYLEGSGNSLEQRSLTGDQVRSAIASETVDDTASDDNVVSESTRISDGQTSIDVVYQDGTQASGINPVAVGETMVVEGTTNFQPEDNTITVELGNNDTTVDLSSTDEWETDGRWSVELDTSDASTGTYTLEADDGENTVTEEVELVEEVSTPTETASGTATATGTATTETPTETATPTETPTPTEEGGPGFGAIVALVALLAAALLATRRKQ